MDLDLDLNLNGNNDWMYSSMLGGDMTQYQEYIAHSPSTLPDTPHTVDNDDDDESLSILETQPSQKKSKRRQGNFTVADDKVLIAIWLNTSMNSIRGTDQKRKAFWLEITDKFRETTKTERSERSVTTRFGEIQRTVNRFIGILAQVEESGKSGYTETNKFQMTKTMYQKVYGPAFRLDHCWDLLKNQPKWLEIAGNTGKKKKINAKQTKEGITGSKDSTSTPSSVDLDNEGNFIDLERPMGNRNAKEMEKQKKRKLENDSSLGSLISDWKVHKLKMHDDKMKIEQEKMAMAKRDEELRHKKAEDKMAMANRDADLKIMTMDLSNADNDQKEYIMMLRAKIMDKCRNEL